MAERIQLGETGEGEAHCAWIDEAGRLVVEWHDFGEDAPYQSANLILFDAEGQRALAAALDVAADLPAALAARFASWFAVKAFAEAHAIAFTREVDFLP